MKKTILVALAVILIAISVGVFFVVSNLDSIVKNIIEEQGSKTLDTSVRVASVSISLADATAELNGFRISNPDGFDTDYAMNFGRIAVGLDKASLTSDVIHITSIDVNDAHVMVEQKSTRINLKELLDNVESGSGSTDAGTSDQDTSGKRVVIDRFVMSNPKMDLVGFGDEDQTLDMGDVRINNIGDPSSGASVSDVAKQLLTPVLAEAIKKAARNALKEKVSGETDKLGNRVSKKLGKLFGKDSDDDDDNGDDD